MSVTRLSRKAQEEAARIGAKIEEIIRTMASNRAAAQGREYADLHDVNEAHRMYWLEVCEGYVKAKADDRPTEGERAY